MITLKRVVALLFLSLFVLPVRGEILKVEIDGPIEPIMVRESGYSRWPPRLPGQPIFYPVTNLEYATEIARKWNVKDSGAGFVTKFSVRKEFADRYPIQRVGGVNHTEWWIPAEDLEELNNNIVGAIEVVAEYRGA